MWFPDKKLDIAKNRFNVNDKVIYLDKDKGEHIATVLNVNFKDLLSGYSYAIELEEPLNGMTKYIVSEKRIRCKVKSEKKERKSKKTEA